MRGGTSKGVFFMDADLPRDAEDRDRAILGVMGSPDPRQINGLGGADPLTSKIAIIAPGGKDDADVTYTFGQVGIDQSYVRYSGNCGNISSAVGVYAIQEGLIEADGPFRSVRIYNTNSDKILIARIPIANGQPQTEGSFAIAGVPGTGAEIRLDFSQTAGATTGRLLPTGNPSDQLYVPALGREITVSIVDVAKATLFFHASELGLAGTEGPEGFSPEALQLCWSIHEAAAEMIGLDPHAGHLPTPCPVAAPADYTNYMTGETVHSSDMSFVARRVIGPPPRLHKAFAGTGAIAAGVAAELPGTVVNAVARNAEPGIVRLGHPTGVMPLIIRLEGLKVVHASLSRTARRLMDGVAYVPAGAPTRN